MPGGFIGYQNGTKILNSSGVFSVQLYDNNNNPVKLPEGNYTIKFKLSPYDYAGIEDYDPNTPEVEIPLWYLDEDRGVWVRKNEYGILVYKDDTPVKREDLPDIVNGKSNVDIYVKGNVKHLSFINCDIPTKPAGISGRLKGIDCKKYRIYTEVIGVNWNGGQGGNYANENCYFSIPVPWRENFGDIDDQKKNCPPIVFEHAFDFLNNIHKLAVAPDIPEYCQDLWSMVEENSKNLALRISDFFWDLAENPSLSETDKDTARKMGDTLAKLIALGKYGDAINEIEEFKKIFIEGGKINAKDFLEPVKNLRKKMVHDAIAQILGISLGNIKISISQSGSNGQQEENKPEFNLTLAGFLETVVDAYNKNIDPCLTPFVKEAVKAAGGKIDSYLIDYVASLGGKPAQEITSEDMQKVRKVLNFVSTFPSKIVDFNKGILKEDFTACLKKVAQKYPKLQQFINLGDDVFVVAKEGTEVAARGIIKYAGTALISAQIVAAGIQMYFDIYNTERFIKNKEVQLYFENTLNQAKNMIALTLQNIPNECFPKDIFPPSFYDKDFPKECSIGRMFSSYLKSTSMSLHMLKLVSKKFTIFDPLIFLKFLLDLDTKISAVNGGESLYTKWYNEKNGKFLEKLPSSIEGNVTKFGGYLSRLVITIPQLGIYRLPLNKVTSLGIDTNAIPSPGIYAYQSDKVITAWIGEIDISDLFEKVNVTLNYSIELPKEAKISEIKDVYITFESLKGRFAPTIHLSGKDLNCRISKTNVICIQNTLSNYLGEKVNILTSFIINYKGKKVTLTAYNPDVYFSESISLNSKFVVCKRPLVKSIKLPERIEPNKEYFFSAELAEEEYLASECNQQKKYIYEWYIGKLRYTSEGNSITWKSPDKLFFKDYKENIPVFLKVCAGQMCSTKMESIPVIVENKPPRIKNISVPDVISSLQDEFSVDVNAEDADNDTLTYSWYSESPIFTLKTNGKSAIFKVSHGLTDINAKVCVEVSDGFDKEVTCKSVLVKKRVYPPKITRIIMDYDKLSVPTAIKFKVEFTSDGDLNRIYVDISGAEDKNLSFNADNFTISFEKAGTYNLKFQVEDVNGLRSNSFIRSITLYQPIQASIIVNGKITEVFQNSYHIKLRTNFITNKDVTILYYLWDLDNDGTYDVKTLEPELDIWFQKNVDKGTIGVKVVTRTDHYEADFNISNIEPYIVVSPSTTDGKTPLTVNFAIDVFMPGKTVSKYMLDYDGDGVYDIQSSKNLIAYTYTKSGIYYPRVKIIFSDNSEFVKELENPIMVKSSGYGYLYQVLVKDLYYFHFSENIYGDKPLNLIKYTYRKQVDNRTIFRDGILLLENNLENPGMTSVKTIEEFESLNEKSIGVINLGNDYIVALRGYIFDSNGNKIAGICIFRFDKNNVIKWKKCYKSTHSGYYTITGNVVGMGLNSGKLYIGFGSCGYAGNVIVIVNPETGDVEFKTFKLEGNYQAFEKLYVDDGGIYIVPCGYKDNKKLLIKFNSSLNVESIKSFSVVSEATYIDQIYSDKNYLYILLKIYTFPNTLHYYLWKLDKKTGNKVFEKSIFYSYNAHSLTHGFVSTNALYWGASYSYWSNFGQLLLKVYKNGELGWINELDVCQKYKCVDPIIRVYPLRNDYVSIIGELFDSETGQKSFYNFVVSMQDGLANACSNYIKPTGEDPSNYGFSDNKSGSEYKDETNLIEASVEDMSSIPEDVDVQINIEDRPDLLTETPLCQ